MLPDRVSNPGPLTYESGALPIAKLWKKIIMYIEEGTPLLSLFVFVLCHLLSQTAFLLITKA